MPRVPRDVMFGVLVSSGCVDWGEVVRARTWSDLVGRFSRKFEFWKCEEKKGPQSKKHEETQADEVTHQSWHSMLRNTPLFFLCRDTSADVSPSVNRHLLLFNQIKRYCYRYHVVYVSLAYQQTVSTLCFTMETRQKTETHTQCVLQNTFLYGPIWSSLLCNTHNFRYILWVVSQAQPLRRTPSGS